MEDRPGSDAEKFVQQVESGQHDEPLADWERELLDKGDLRQRVDSAEATLARVRAQIECWRHTPDRKRAAEEMASVLDQPAGRQPCAEEMR